MDKEIIVKVQISIFSSENDKVALVYDEDRKFEHQGLASKELLKLMNGEDKNFFYATIKNKNFVLGEEAPWQDW